MGGRLPEGGIGGIWVQWNLRGNSGKKGGEGVTVGNHHTEEKWKIEGRDNEDTVSWPVDWHWLDLG